jgi:pilus assembly protein CpaE
MQSLTFITFDRDLKGALEIKEALGRNPVVRLLGECNNPDKFFAEVQRLRPSAVVMVLDPSNYEKDLLLVKKLSELSAGTVVITAAYNCSPSFVLASMRSGAREVLQLPIITDELHTVLNRTAEFSESVETSQKCGRVVAVFSGKGGVGVSFLATNLAAALDQQTLLVDLNLQTGDAASFLGIEPRYTLTDFVLNRNRLDDSLIGSMITQHSPQLSLLPAPLEPHEADDIDATNVTEVMRLLSRKYECVVLDLPHTFDPLSIAALDMADDILLVMTLDIPGIRATKRALKVFGRLGYASEKIHVVVNRWSKGAAVDLSKVEAHLDEQLIGLVPNDYRKVIESINLGRPLVQAEPSSKLTAEIKRIAAKVSGIEHTTSAPPRKGLLSGMFGRQKTQVSFELMELAESA